MNGKKIALLALLILGSVGCDQVTKVAARQHLDGRGTLSYLGDTFRLTYAENSGAFLGLGSSLPEEVRIVLFVVMVGLFLTALTVWLLRRSGSLSSLALLASGLLLGGGIGNLIDRVAFDGRVTDFMNLGIGSLRTGIFNMADVWIMVGMALMVLAPELRGQDRDDEPAAEDEAGTTAEPG